MKDKHTRMAELAAHDPALGRALKDIDGAHNVGTSLAHHVLAIEERVDAYKRARSVLRHSRAHQPAAPIEELDGAQQVRSQKAHLINNMRAIKGFLSMCAEETHAYAPVKNIPHYADAGHRLAKNPDEAFTLESFRHQHNGALRTVANHWQQFVDKLPENVRDEYAREWDVEWDYNLNKEQFPLNPDEEMEREQDELER